MCPVRFVFIFGFFKIFKIRRVSDFPVFWFLQNYNKIRFLDFWYFSKFEGSSVGSNLRLQAAFDTGWLFKLVDRKWTSNKCACVQCDLFSFLDFWKFSKFEGSRVGSNLRLKAAFDAGWLLKLVARNSICLISLIMSKWTSQLVLPSSGLALMDRRNVHQRVDRIDSFTRNRLPICRWRRSQIIVRGSFSRRHSRPSRARTVESHY